MVSEELLKTLQNRRSIYPIEYTDEKISEEELKLLLEAANWAPTHKKTEPWRFKIVQGEGKERLKEFMKRVYVQSTSPEKLSERKLNDMAEKCDKSQAIILISFIDTGKVPEWEELGSTAMAVQNMWLMCGTLNIGSYWSSPANIIANMDEFTPMQEGEKCVGIFYLGKATKRERLAQRKPIEDKVVFINH